MCGIIENERIFWKLVNFRFTCKKKQKNEGESEFRI